MQLKYYKTTFSEQLSLIYPQTEIDTFFYYLIEAYLGLQRIDLIMQPTFEISNEKEVLFNTALEKLIKQEPIQYIIGNTEFYGFPFKVTNDTLIPRPETEELVEWILNELNSVEKTSILDIGTGTGCIPISLKKHLKNANISAIDVSKEALKVANKNADLNNVLINFLEQDILKTTSLNIVKNKTKQSGIQKEIISNNNYNNVKFDIIVSNPPYVRELEKVEIKNNVLENEPHLALFVEDNNPLIFYDKIADLAKIHLTKKGFLFFEINQYLGKETIKMLEDKGFKKIELKKDFSGNDRMIKATF